MAKKKASSQKPSAVVATTKDSAVLDDSPKTKTPVETPASKTKVKANDAPASDGNVGIGEIKKAVAFANSVGGLDKAIALLQILKVAKDVQ
jgi:hypothetical protein